MITRIEIDGFKSFADFSLDLPPFLAIIGTNASGKSNFVEALTFFATAATDSLDDAVSAVRGDARGLFRQRGDGSRSDRMRFATEFLLDPQWRDIGTRFRYEIELSWGVQPGHLEGLVVDRQRLARIDQRKDDWPDRFGASRKWRDEHLSYDEDVSPYVKTNAVDRQSALLFEFFESQGSDLGGFIQELSIVRALHLEAAALRAPSEIGGPEFMDEHGRHLPNFLRWLASKTGDEDRPMGVVADIETHLVGLVREVSGLEVVVDEERRDVRLEFSSPYSGPVGAELASDGALRMLAVLAALHDPRRGGLMAVEEPENGVFPERLRHLLGLMQDLVSDISGAPEHAGLKQALVTSHSPLILDCVERSRIVFLDTTTVLEDGVASHVTRARWLREADGPARIPDERWARVTESELRRFRAGVEATA